MAQQDNQQFQKIQNETTSFDNIIRIEGQRKGLPDQSKIAGYLTNTVLFLRDRENVSQSVVLEGLGSAIPVCILIAEIVGNKIPGVNQITELSSLEENNTGNSQKRSNVVMRITLSLQNLSENEEYKSRLVGYQQRSSDNPSAYQNLYEFVLMYANELTQVKNNKNKTGKKGNKSRSKNYNRQGEKKGFRPKHEQQESKGDQQEKVEQKDQDKNERRGGGERTVRRGGRNRNYGGQYQRDQNREQRPEQQLRAGASRNRGGRQQYGYKNTNDRDNQDRNVRYQEINQDQQNQKV